MKNIKKEYISPDASLLEVCKNDIILVSFEKNEDVLSIAEDILIDDFR